MKRFYNSIVRLVPKRFRDDSGATMLEWALLLAGVVLPFWVIMQYGLDTLAAHYGLVTTLNQMPFP